LTGTCAALARNLLTHSLHTADGSRLVAAEDIAVVCAHVTQAAAVRATLSDLPAVLVGTANQLQGMERPAVICLHPLAGYRDPNAFGADLGRACVMFSRHRAHMTVVTDDTTPGLLRTTDPSPAVIAQRRLLAALTSAPSP
jgi:hypothetical protein